MEAKRKAVMDLVHAGKSTKEISHHLNVYRNTVRNVKRLYDETGGFRKRSGGTRRTVRTRSLISRVKRRVQYNPWRSIQKMAKEMAVSSTTMSRVIKHDLKAKSRAITTRQLITDDSRKKRLERAKILLSDVKHSPGRVTIFSDEKFCHVDRVFNRRNSSYISDKSPEYVPEQVKHVFRSKNPVKFMVLGVVAPMVRNVLKFSFPKMRR